MSEQRGTPAPGTYKITARHWDEELGKIGELVGHGPDLWSTYTNDRSNTWTRGFVWDKTLPCTTITNTPNATIAVCASVPPGSKKTTSPLVDIRTPDGATIVISEQSILHFKLQGKQQQQQQHNRTSCRPYFHGEGLRIKACCQDLSDRVCGAGNNNNRQAAGTWSAPGHPHTYQVVVDPGAEFNPTQRALDQLGREAQRLNAELQRLGNTISEKDRVIEHLNRKHAEHEKTCPRKDHHDYKVRLEIVKQQHNQQVARLEAKVKDQEQQIALLQAQLPKSNVDGTAGNANGDGTCPVRSASEPAAGGGSQMLAAQLGHANNGKLHAFAQQIDEQQQLIKQLQGLVAAGGGGGGEGQGLQVAAEGEDAMTGVETAAIHDKERQIEQLQTVDIPARDRRIAELEDLIKAKDQRIHALEIPDARTADLARRLAVAYRQMTDEQISAALLAG